MSAALEHADVVALAAEPAAATVSRRQIWSATPITARLAILRRARSLIAAHAERLADAMPATLARTPADSLAAEVLPLLAACQFLERNAQHLLNPRRLGRRGLPFWLAGVHATVERVALGHVLVLAPYNYPLFLPGVQALQALAAGNTVTWKPGAGGAPVASLFAELLHEAGLPEGVLTITDESVASAQAALAQPVDKIVFTGSATTGRLVATQAAQRVIPMIAELSGCDAVFVLPSAKASRVAEALAFGLRLNGSATCMAPRRLFLIGQGHAELLTLLRRAVSDIPPVTVSQATAQQVNTLLTEARANGARVEGLQQGTSMTPHLIFDAQPQFAIAQADVFAPVLSIFTCADTAEALAADGLCPFGLTAAVFGEEAKACALAEQLNVGTALINDLIVPTADPRVPFGGRRQSGHGVTRGAEGLLAMTAVKVTSVRRGKDQKHYQATGPDHQRLFLGVIQMTHAASILARFKGMQTMVAAARKLGRRAPLRSASPDTSSAHTKDAI